MEVLVLIPGYCTITSIDRNGAEVTFKAGDVDQPKWQVM